MSTTYVIPSPAGLGHHHGAHHLATALGCNTLVPEWNGIEPLPTGALAFTHDHHIPPEDACVTPLQTVAEMARMADEIFTLQIDPPHVTHALRRIAHGMGSEHEANTLHQYHITLRRRIAHAYNGIMTTAGSATQEGERQ